MEFKEYIDDHLQGNPKYSFWQKLLRVIEDAYNHLNLISEQMPTYDIHDSRHSEKVQENIFKLINPKIESLSLYELILMYAAGSFHDVGMALPAWEFDLLKATEGTDEIHDNSLQILIGNDFKSPMSLSAIKEFVDSHKDVIYGSFDEAREFVFAPSSEDSLQTALVNSIAEYQLFRNRRAAELQEALPDSAAFLAVSKQIRSDYIRDTHHVRVERYVYALQEAFSDCLGDLDAHRFVSDLAAVCRSHGEEYKFVTNLDSASSVSDLGGANLRFVATVLRIGDIVHYDAKRAPASLRAEKLIYKSPSMPHWTTKDEDVSYDIVSSSEGGVIRFKAFCTNPDSFYNLHDYIDQINHELAHYYSFLNGAVPDERSKYMTYRYAQESTVHK